MSSLVKVLAWCISGAKTLSEREFHYCQMCDCSKTSTETTATKGFNPLQWRHNECNAVSNHRRLESLPNRLYECRSKKTSKLRITGLCEGNSQVAGEFLAQKPSNAENVSIWWRHHTLQWTRSNIISDSSNGLLPFDDWSSHEPVLIYQLYTWHQVAYS